MERIEEFLSRKWSDQVTLKVKNTLENSKKKCKEITWETIEVSYVKSAGSFIQEQGWYTMGKTLSPGTLLHAIYWMGSN